MNIQIIVTMVKSNAMHPSVQILLHRDYSRLLPKINKMKLVQSWILIDKGKFEISAPGA